VRDLRRVAGNTDPGDSPSSGHPGVLAALSRPGRAGVTICYILPNHPGGRPGRGTLCLFMGIWQDAEELTPTRVKEAGKAREGAPGCHLPLSPTPGGGSALR